MNKQEFKTYLEGKGIKVDEQRLDQEIAALGGSVPDDLAEVLAEDLSKSKAGKLAKPTGGKMTKSSGRGQIRKKELKREIPEIPQVQTIPIGGSFALGTIDSPSVTLQRQALALRTVERFQTNERLIGEVAACDQAVDDDLVCGLLQLYNCQISEILDLSYDEIFEGTAADRQEVWNQYTEACRVLNAETDQFIQKTLSQPSGVSRWKVGAS